MTEGNDRQRPPAARELVGSAERDDSGVRTQSAFRFQHECTARLCIPMFVRESVLFVVCEEHEDFVVFYEAAPPELVSVKHRDPSRGAWTFDALLSDGGVEHLYDRWLATGRSAGCRLMTNGALKTGENQARAFADACHSRDVTLLESWAKKVIDKLQIKGSKAEAQVRHFCQGLSIESDLPGRAHIGAVNLRELVSPALERCGIETGLAEACYERLLDAIARANRDAVGDRIDLIDVVADPSRLEPEAALDRRLARRTIDRDVATSLLLGPSTTVPSLGAPRGTDPPPHASRLQLKLKHGGLGPTAIASAVGLRAAWYGYERARRLNVPGGDRAFDDLRTRVQELVALSESRQDRSKQYAAAMHIDIRDTVNVGALMSAPSFPLDDQLLQGLVFQLTDECTVWWSDEFDVGSAV